MEKFMDKSKFETEMRRADIMRTAEPNKSEYWSGYQRGLRRALHGENFGTDIEHNQWLDAINADDDSHQQRGLGYRDGLNVFSLSASEIGRKGGSVSSEAKTAAVRINAKKGGWPKGKKRKPDNL